MPKVIAFKLILSGWILLGAVVGAGAQEVLNNRTIIEMTNAGVDKEIVLAKIQSSSADFDVTARALIELKKAGVDDRVVRAMLEVFNRTNKQNLNPAAQNNAVPIVKSDAGKTAAQLLTEAHTIFFLKHSLYPSLSDIESSVLKRPGWNKFNLTITRNAAEADLIVEINHEFLTHYNFRTIDQKTGRVIAASGVTSLGGALAGNVADKIIKRFNEVLANTAKTEK